MYLSRIALDTGKRATLQALANACLFHSAIEGCFSRNARQHALWRLDELKGNLYLLVASQDVPDCKEIIKKYGIGDYKTISYDCVRNILKVGNRYRFRVKVNPVRQRNGKRYGHVTVDQQMDWFLEKAARFGFTVKPGEFDITERRREVFYNEKKDCEITLNTAVIEGVLIVADVDVFCNTLYHGMGQGKAYGCGMLTIV